MTRRNERDIVVTFQTVRAPVEILSASDIAKLDAAWREIISDSGVQFAHAGALAILTEAGQRVNDQTVFFDADWVAARVAEAPSTFAWQARNPERSIPLGQGIVSFAPTYGSPFVLKGGVRAAGTLEDLHQFVGLIQDAPDLT